MNPYAVCPRDTGTAESLALEIRGASVGAATFRPIIHTTDIDALLGVYTGLQNYCSRLIRLEQTRELG